MSATTETHTRHDSILAGRRTDDRGPRIRPRRKGLLAFASLLIVGSALAGGVLFARAGDTVEVLAARDGVAKGHTIAQGDLVTKNVAGIDGAVLLKDSNSVIGKTAVVDLIPGQVLTRAMVSGDPTPGTGKSTVGLSLDNARVPAAGLHAGDVVDVIAVPAAENSAASADELDAPPVLAADAAVYKVKGRATEGGGVMVTLIVDESAAARIAAYSTAGRVAVVETSSTGRGAS